MSLCSSGIRRGRSRCPRRGRWGRSWAWRSTSTITFGSCTGSARCRRTSGIQRPPRIRRLPSAAFLRRPSSSSIRQATSSHLGEDLARATNGRRASMESSSTTRTSSGQPATARKTRRFSSSRTRERSCFRLVVRGRARETATPGILAEPPTSRWTRRRTRSMSPTATGTAALSCSMRRAAHSNGCGAPTETGRTTRI